MIQPLQELFEKPMGRREFLGYLGAGFLAIIGVSGLIKSLQQRTHQSSGYNRKQADGYGATPYGGGSA